MGRLKVVVVTPERTTLEQDAEFVVLPLFDGELGVLPGRARMIGRLGFGEMRIREAGKTDRYYVDGGFAQVADDTVAVLTSKAIAAPQLNLAQLQEEFDDIHRKRPHTPEEAAARDRQLKQTRGQIRVAQKT